MALEGKFAEVGTALISWWAGHAPVQALGLVSLAWQGHMQPSPVFPCDPVASLPRAYLRAYTEEYSRGTSLGCGATSAKFVYRYSLWVQLRQTPGQSHQTLLLAALAPFRDAILQSNFVPSLNVPGAYIENVTPAQGVVHDEMIHPLGSIRVSVGEINITVLGDTYIPD